MSVVLLDREIVHYEVLGRGRPLIFLHGWVGSWRYWIPAMQAASIGFRAYALDLWGFGDSAKNRRYTVRQQAELVETFMERMGIGRAALIGHGLGAVVAMEVARCNPAAVDRVMAVALPQRREEIAARLWSEKPGALAEWLYGRNELNEPVLVDAPKTDPAALAASLESMAAGGTPFGVDHLPMAALLVYGSNDPVVQYSGPKASSNLPPHAHAIVFDGSGHFPMIEESSKFNRLLLEFLSLPPGETPRGLHLKEEWKRRVR